MGRLDASILFEVRGSKLSPALKDEAGTQNFLGMFVLHAID